MRTFAIVILILVLTIFLGCNKERDEEIADLQIELQQLKKENKELKEQLARLEEYIKAQKKLLQAQEKFKNEREKAMKLRNINITLANMRNMVTALEMYHAEHNSYPDSLLKLQPDYIISIPLVDSWENEIIYILDEANQEYQLISKGADGEIDTDDDIIYSRGRFVKTRYH